MSPATRTRSNPSRPRRVFNAVKRVVKLAAWTALALTLLALGSSLLGLATVSVDRPPPPLTVDDVTRLNPVQVAGVIVPTTTEEIVDAVRRHPGPVAIGGGRYSMGGQTATPGGLQIDMRQFNRVLAFEPAQKTITVQAGIRWRQIQEQIDSAGLSVKIMQSYSNFTVGGSLSVNVHGRYVGLGPLILSVRSIRIVLADGTLLNASPTENPEVFYGAIGGYGGLGVITEATLDLADNARVKRTDETMPVTAYRQYFFDQVREAPEAVFHNGDLYPNDYNTVHAVTFNVTADSVTVSDRLVPAGQSYRLNRFVYSVISEWPFGKGIRRLIVDPILYRGEPVVWRNYEASYDVAELEPSSRTKSTYVLQEYFVPVENFDRFVPRMAAVLRKGDVNVINISIRHARPDPGSLLAWARGEVFAFVLYYKQDTDRPAREAVGIWTRELLDTVLAAGGTYYLPYQPHATEGQFLRAYPRAPEYFSLKRRLDPANKFRNSLWNSYYLPRQNPMERELAPEIQDRLAGMKGYRRDGGQTFLTHPEWYIVYSSDEYADYMREHLPTGFPYMASIGQYWACYREAGKLIKGSYPYNWGYHLMLWVIGLSYSTELALKGLYENTVGRFSGWTAGHELSDEDRFAHEVAADYGQFIHVRPWYEYRFGPRLKGVWTDVPLWGKHPFRKWERKGFLTIEYGIKAIYAALIKVATRATYGVAEDRMQMVVTGWNDRLATADSGIRILEQLDDVHTLIATPRYDRFRDVMTGLAQADSTVTIREIAGNREIFLTGVAPAGWTYPGVEGVVPYTLPLPTDPARKRFTLRLPVPRLLATLRQLDAEGVARVDHVYDY